MITKHKISAEGRLATVIKELKAIGDIVGVESDCDE